MMRPEELEERLQEIKEDILSNGTVVMDTENDDIELLVSRLSVDEIKSMEEYHDLCTECICNEEISTIFMNHDMSLEYTQYDDYEVSIEVAYSSDSHGQFTS